GRSKRQRCRSQCQRSSRQRDCSRQYDLRHGSDDCRPSCGLRHTPSEWTSLLFVREYLVPAFLRRKRVVLPGRSDAVELEIREIFGSDGVGQGEWHELESRQSKHAFLDCWYDGNCDDRVSNGARHAAAREACGCKADCCRQSAGTASVSMARNPKRWTAEGKNHRKEKRRDEGLYGRGESPSRPVRTAGPPEDAAGLPSWKGIVKSAGRPSQFDFQRLFHTRGSDDPHV